MSYQTAFSYDSRSNLTCVRDPQNGLTYYTYDADNRQTSVRNPWGEVTYYEYSPGGQMIKRTLGNGCVTYYRYDATGQTSKVENRKGDLAVISSFEYTRDALGNPLRIVREDGYATYYQYDTKSQLTGETQRTGQGQNVYAWAWDYDAAGNRTRQTFNGVATYYSYNAGNELTTETTGAATTYYQYDRCGNTTVQQAPGGTTYYHWDHENLLKQLDLPGNAHNYFSYDADSKRVTKQDSEGFTRFLYQGPDMLKLLQERDAGGSLVAHYTMGQGLEAMRRSTASRFYHYDWLGSTFELTDASGTVTDSYLYNVWGKLLDKAGTTMNPHGYVGRERYYLTPGTGLYHVGHRHLDSRLGRFISTDWLREGSNWYAYVGQNPSSAVDPTGDIAPVLIIVIVGGVLIILSLAAVSIWKRKHITPFTQAEATRFKAYIDQIGKCQALNPLIRSLNLVGYDDNLDAETSGETRAGIMFWAKYTVLSRKGTDFPQWDHLQTLIHEALHSKCCWKSLSGNTDDPNTPHGRVYSWAAQLAEGLRKGSCCLPKNICQVINSGKTPQY